MPRLEISCNDIVIIWFMMSAILKILSHVCDTQLFPFQVLAEAKHIMESRAANKVSKSVHWIPYFLSLK